jgi:uncharacterized membrane protein
METKRTYKLLPTFGTSYGTGWKVMSDNFLRLLLVVILLGILAAPMSVKSNFHLDDLNVFDHFNNGGFSPDDLIKFGAFGIFAGIMGLIALMYALLVLPVFRFGSKMMFVQAVRQQTPDFDMLVRGFRKNYLNIVLANLLVAALIGIGIVCLIIPGIIIACRLAFTAYLVMDKGMDPIKAAEESWRLTRGHGWTIFLMGFISFFICIAGFICLFFGVLISVMWIKSAFASLYHSTLIEKGLYEIESPEEVTV